MLPEEYMANSPMFQAQKIKTPLLVAFGTNDDIIKWHQGIEMFIIKRIIEKPYIMLIYNEKTIFRKKLQIKSDPEFTYYILSGKQ